MMSGDDDDDDTDEDPDMMSAMLNTTCALAGVCGAEMFVDGTGFDAACDGLQLSECGEAVMASPFGEDMPDHVCLMLQCNDTMNALSASEDGGPPECVTCNETEAEATDSCSALVAGCMAECDGCMVASMLMMA